MSHTRIFEWHKSFQEGHEKVKADNRCKKKEVNVRWIRPMVCGDRPLTLRMIASQLGIKKKMMERSDHAENLQKHWDKTAKWRSEGIPRLQTQPELICRVISRDETSICYCDITQDVTVGTLSKTINSDWLDKQVNRV